MALFIFSSPAYANIISFDDFTPLSASVVAGSLPESEPLLLSSPQFSQKTISANDRGPENNGIKLGDSWDMITLNETGPQLGQYLFTPYEIRSSGVKRLDLISLESVTIVPQGSQGFAYGDSSLWTPWGTYLTSEETWYSTSPNGRLFEITNPLAHPSEINFVHRSIIPRVAIEGLKIGKDNTLYFSDEAGGGSLFKYVSKTPNIGETFFDAGQSFVLVVEGGNNFETLGAASWIPLTDIDGHPLPGIPTLPDDPNSIDGRAAAIIIGATGFSRPEDMEIQNLDNGTSILYFSATGSAKVFSLNISDENNPFLSIFVDQNTLDMASQLSVGDHFLNPDNLAIDTNQNIYILEDYGSISDEGFDIWFALDENKDGQAESIGRWASLSTLGAEPTGLYFNPFDPSIAYLNVQHAQSDIDRTIQITANVSVPEPNCLFLFLLGMLYLIRIRLTNILMFSFKIFFLGSRN